jgi:hypothetical protein
MLSLFETPEEELENFLYAYFHQDAISLDAGLNDFINECSLEDITVVRDAIREFLKNDMNDSEKSEFIESKVSFVFENTTPLEWLQDVEKKLNDRLKNA